MEQKYFIIYLLICAQLAYRAICSDTESENNEISSEKTLEQIMKILTLILSPIFDDKKMNFETAKFDEISETVKEIGFERLAKKIPTKEMKQISKSEALIGTFTDMKDTHSKLGRMLAHYRNKMERLFKTEGQNGEEKKKTMDQMFGVFLYSRICEKILDTVEETSCKAKKNNGKMEFVRIFLNKLRRNLYRKFENAKRKMMESLKKDGEKIEKSKEENDAKLEGQKATQRNMFENVTKNIQKESEIALMEREFSLFFQRFEESHRFTRDKIYELKMENSEIRRSLARLNVAGSALQIVHLQIRLSLFDGIEKAVGEDEINSLLCDAEEDGHTAFISDSKFLIKIYEEQKELTPENKENFVQFLGKIKHDKMDESFKLLLSTEFRHSSHRNSLERRINFVKKSVEKSFKMEKLWEYLSKFEGLGLNDESLNETKMKANEFANLLLYDQMYKAFFRRFFGGQKCEVVLENFPKNFDENMPPEKYSAYWLIEIGKSLRKNLVMARQKLIFQIDHNLAILEQILNGKMIDEMKQFKKDYKKIVKGARKWAAGTENLMLPDEKSVEFIGKKSENVRRMREIFAKEVKEHLAMANATNLALLNQLCTQKNTTTTEGERRTQSH